MRTRAIPTYLCLAACAAVIACSSTPEAAATASQGFRSRSDSDRKLIRSAQITVTVGALPDAQAEVERIIAGARGFVESSTVAEASVSLQARIPAESLDSVLDTIAKLGTLENRSIMASDVTEQHADLKTRLANDLALRDRLKLLLDRAKDVEDVLAIEKELTRIQSEIETMQGTLARLDSQIELSQLSVSLQRRRILGPLGYVSYGLWWGISKLFVIRSR